ncbi:hypothetical protein PROFUN_05654 [Planoprotostelium fungivorum]|uniref:Uncharacterized protein n=1 Tax=Planoprotostelium fungivorum TaxID=1890364 RepID=A0A2P6MUH1_9EUKA|nr:hypothetical protein PROFUN_05654 [Planoprotostelium fungivorum]
MTIVRTLCCLTREHLKFLTAKIPAKTKFSNSSEQHRIGAHNKMIDFIYRILCIFEMIGQLRPLDPESVVSSDSNKRKRGNSSRSDRPMKQRAIIITEPSATCYSIPNTSEAELPPPITDDSLPDYSSIPPMPASITNKFCDIQSELAFLRSQLSSIPAAGTPLPQPITDIAPNSPKTMREVALKMNAACREEAAVIINMEAESHNSIEELPLPLPDVAEIPEPILVDIIEPTDTFSPHDDDFEIPEEHLVMLPPKPPRVRLQPPTPNQSVGRRTLGNRVISQNRDFMKDLLGGNHSLRKVNNIERSPGGTPIRSHPTTPQGNDTASILARALKSKFRSVNESPETSPSKPEESWRTLEDDGWYDERDEYTYCVKTPIKEKGTDAGENVDKENNSNGTTTSVW